MSITLTRLENGSTNYVGIHNGNLDTLESIINALQSQVGAAPTLFSGNTGEALFGAANSIVVEGSYLPTGSGSDLTVAAGYFWHFATQTVRRKLTSTVISFSGLSAATYYIVVDPLGEPTRSDTSTGACYSVAWTGSAFGTITRLVPIAWGYGTFNAAKTSTALGATYQSLDTRLEAGEAAPVAALAAHVAASDPHTGYQRESEKSAANGYASLDSGGKVPASELPSSGAGSGTVTSVGLAMPAQFSIAGSPITASGTLTVTWTTESANTVLAGPSSGGAAVPSFRALVPADLPTLVGDSGSGGTKGAAPAPAAGDAAAGKFLKADGTWAVVSGASGGTVTSVGLSLPAEFSVSGSPVSASGTLTATKANQSANQVYAGPTSGGAAAPAFRALVAGDIPAQPYDVGSFIEAAPTASQVVLRHGLLAHRRLCLWPVSERGRRGNGGHGANRLRHPEKRIQRRNHALRRIGDHGEFYHGLADYLQRC